MTAIEADLLIYVTEELHRLYDVLVASEKEIMYHKYEYEALQKMQRFSHCNIREYFESLSGI